LTTTTTTNPYAPPRAAVRDIVDPLLRVVPADRGARLGAAFLDGIIFGAMVYLPLFAGIFIGGTAGAAANGEQADMPFIVGTGLALVGFIIWCWLTVKYVRENGQSIAKKMLEIKVVRSDGSPVTLSRVFWLRNFVNGLVSMVPLYGLIDILFIFSESRQCLHDKIADTIVVKV
jgi:uncharacterized RDD family membrane protein YckC